MDQESEISLVSDRKKSSEISEKKTSVPALIILLGASLIDHAGVISKFYNKKKVKLLVNDPSNAKYQIM